VDTQFLKQKQHHRQNSNFGVKYMDNLVIHSFLSLLYSFLFFSSRLPLLLTCNCNRPLTSSPHPFSQPSPSSSSLPSSSSHRSHHRRRRPPTPSDLNTPFSPLSLPSIIVVVVFFAV